MKLPHDAERRLDEHLDAIERVLSEGGMHRPERRSIVDEVEAQVREMLAERVGEGGEPTLADMDTVLVEVDPPEAYAGDEAGAGTERTLKASTSEVDASAARYGRISLRLCIGGLLCLLFVPALMAVYAWATTPPNGMRVSIALTWGVAVLVFVICQVVAIPCGILGWRTPVGKAGTVTASVLLGLTVIAGVLVVA